MLFDLVQELPEVELTIDLDAQIIKLPIGADLHFNIDPFARTCLLQGVDELGYILSHETQIAAFEHKSALSLQ